MAELVPALVLVAFGLNPLVNMLPIPVTVEGVVPGALLHTVSLSFRPPRSISLASPESLITTAYILLLSPCLCFLEPVGVVGSW
jgi:hypothetical protein